jgi:acetyl esterase
MPVSKESRQVLDMFRSAAAEAGKAPATASPLEALRASAQGFGGLMNPKEPVDVTSDVTFKGPDGNSLLLRVYRPKADHALPIIVYLHGGGFVMGDTAVADPISRALANRAASVVVAVEYRKAPEHPFPAGLEDAYAALCWLYNHAEEIGGNPTQIVLAGDSSGGNFAAVLPLLSKERGGPQIALQVLLYPVTDTNMETPSWKELGNGDYVVSAQSMSWYFSMYLNGADPNDPHVSPMKAKFLGGMPPAFIAIPEYDPLRNWGESYARRLEKAGVEVDLRVYEGQIHGFWWMSALIPRGLDLFQDIAHAVQRRFATRCPFPH